MTNNRANKFLLTIIGTLIVALVIGSVHIYGQVSVHAARLDGQQVELRNNKGQLQSMARDIADIKADVREVRTILERFEDTRSK